MSDPLNVSTVDVDFTISSSIGFTSSDRPIGHSLRALPDSILRTWRGHLTRRACRTAERYLRGLDEAALAGIGLRRTEIPSAVRQLEVALLRHCGCASSTSSTHGDTP